MGRHKKRGAKKTLTPLQYKKNQQEANIKWRKEHTKSCNLTLNQDTDKDIIEWLSKQQNRQGYIKELIRQDMKSKS